MQLRFYAMTALMLFLALGFVLSMPMVDTVAPAPALVSAPVEITRAPAADDLVFDTPAQTIPAPDTSPSSSPLTLGLVGLMKDAREQGATNADIRYLLQTLTGSGPLQPRPLQVSVGAPYRVHPGETLAGIAVAFYGTPTAMVNIYVANRKTLTSLSDIPVGTVLQLP